MIAELKSLHSPDVHDLENYVPEAPDCFGFLLQMMIGPDNDMGSESFDAMVCTPEWLNVNFREHEIIWGRHYIIVFQYDYRRLVDRIENYLATCKGDSWAEVALKVCRIGHWEFEDHDPD